MASNKLQFVLPPGRWIWGSLTELVTKNMQGQPLPPEKHHYAFGVAVRKDNPDVNVCLGKMIPFALEEYRNFPHIQNAANQVIQRSFPHGQVGFAWKIKDGDQPNTKGQIPEEGKGCWIFSYATTLPFKCCDAQNREIDPSTIKRGWFIDVSSSIAWNEKTDSTAGIYLNPVFVRLLAYGQEIVGGPSAEQAFAGVAAPTNLPPGASLQPLAPAGGSVPGGIPGFGGAPAGIPGYGAPPAGMPPFNTGQPAPVGGVPGMPGFGTAPQPGQPANYGAPAGFAAPPQIGAAPGYPAGAPALPGYPSQPAPGTAPNAAFPSNVGAPALPGFPTGQVGFPQQPSNGLPTGYPINPQTGQPVMPHTGFLTGQPGR